MSATVDLPHRTRVSIVIRAHRDLEVIAGIMIRLTGDDHDALGADEAVFLARSVEAVARDVARLREAMEREVGA
jgi:hypothetical protein